MPQLGFVDISLSAANSAGLNGYQKNIRAILFASVAKTLSDFVFSRMPTEPKFLKIT